MIKKVFAVVKKWAWLVVIAIASIFLAQKPKWVKEKEKEIKKRDEEVAIAEKDAGKTYEQYKEAKERNDALLKEAEKGTSEEKIPFDDPVDSANYIDDLLNDIRRN